MLGARQQEAARPRLVRLIAPVQAQVEPAQAPEPEPEPERFPQRIAVRNGRPTAWVAVPAALRIRMMTMQEIVEETGCPRSSVSLAIKRLRLAGKVVVAGGFKLPNGRGCEANIYAWRREGLT